MIEVILEQSCSCELDLRIGLGRSRNLIVLGGLSWIKILLIHAFCLCAFVHTYERVGSEFLYEIVGHEDTVTVVIVIHCAFVRS